MSFRKWSLLLFTLRGVALLLLVAIASHAETESPLGLAIRYRNWPEAIRLVEAGAPIDNTNVPRVSALGMLANRWWGTEDDLELRLKFLNLLLERGADPFAAAATDFYPHGDYAMVEHTLNNGDRRFADLVLTNRPSPARRTPAGDTALHLAAMSNRTNVIAALLAAGFSVNQTNDAGLTPLQSVVWAGSGSFILTNDAPPYFRRWILKGSDGVRASDVAEFLLGRGATLDACSAAGMGMTNQLAALLRSNPASLNLRDGFGRTPLHYAAFGTQTNVAAMVTGAGADTSLRTTKSIRRTRDHNAIAAGSSALHFACLREGAEIVRMLLKAGVSPEQADADGNTPLHVTAHWGATNCSSLLIKAGAPLDGVNVAGKSPLRIAVESGSFGNVELLLKSGARADTGRGGETLLHIAADKNSAGPTVFLEGRGAQTIPSLLRGGIPVDVRDNEGRTPLHRAVTSLNWKAMNILVANGADVNAVDAKGNTALHQIATQDYDLAQYESDEWRAVLANTNRFAGRAGVQQGQQISVNSLTNSSVTAWLLEHGVNPNLTNNEARTALELACSHHWGYWDKKTATNRIAILLKAGAKATNLSKEAEALLQGVMSSQSESTQK